MGILISKLSRLSVVDGRIENEKKIDNFVNIAEQNLLTPKEKFIADDILDPRSATTGIRRTPLVLVKVGGEAPIRPRTFLETNLDETNPSDNSFTSDLEESDVTEHSLSIEGMEIFSNNDETKDDEVDVVENCPDETNNLIVIDDFIDTTICTEKKKKTFIYEDKILSPDTTPVKPKGGRTPLGVVSTNNSPLPSPRGKPWRGIREERLRLGLENTPPPSQEPFPDVVQSAPGKVGIKRNTKKSWARAHWALDESLVI